MTISYESVETIPPKVKQQRKSQSQELVEAALDSPQGKLQVQSDDEAELMNTYKALTQWINRHPDVDIAMRKEADCIYLWKGRPKRRSYTRPAGYIEKRGRPRKPSSDLIG